MFGRRADFECPINDLNHWKRPLILSMSSSHSRNPPSTSSQPANTRPRSPLSLSKHPDSPASSDNETHRPPPQHSRTRTDADDSRERLSIPTPSAQRKVDGDGDVSAAARLPLRLSLTLQNKGSVARDHLASERTFLAYVRTSLAFASAGVGTLPPPPLSFKP
jgi:hypothetical protein